MYIPVWEQDLHLAVVLSFPLAPYKFRPIDLDLLVPLSASSLNTSTEDVRASSPTPGGKSTGESVL